MPPTATAMDLLIVAAQDLLDAERAWIERAPTLARKAPPEVAAYLADEASRSEVQAERLERILADLAAGPAMPNIWLRAILDDAARDAETIIAGPLRGIALVGAFRKAKQSERVSYETAIGLADALGRCFVVEALKATRAEELEADMALTRLLTAQLQAIT